MKRLKFQVWSEHLKQWRTAYARNDMLLLLAGIKFLNYGFKVRIDGKEYLP